MRRRLLRLAAGIGMALMLGGCGKAGEYYEKGQAAFDDGQYESAVLYYTKALEENPHKAEYYIGQGYAYLGMKQYEQARTAFLSAVLEQELELTRQNNKRAWRGIGITYYEEADYTGARAYFEKALEETLLPEMNADLQMYLADTLECEGDYVAAIAVYDTLLAGEREYAAGYRARAYMEYVLGKYEESLSDYESAIALEPDNFDLYFGKYNVLGKLNRTTEQRALLAVLTGIENPTAEDSYIIAKARYFSGEYEQALTELVAAVENGYEDAHYYIGEILRERSDYGEAVYHYTAYISGSGAGDAAAYNQMAVCLLRQERYAEALETVRAGQELSDALHGKQLLFNEIVILEKMGDYNTAYAKAAAYAEKYPEDSRGQEEAEFLSTRVREE